LGERTRCQIVSTGVVVSAPSLQDLLNFVLYGDPTEVLAFGISLLLASIAVKYAADVAEKILALVGFLVIVIAILRLAGIPIIVPVG